MVQSRKAAYIGAGHDMIPVVVCKEIESFIYVDAGPSFDPSHPFVSETSAKKRLDHLNKIVSQIGFFLIRHTRHKKIGIFEYRNVTTNQTIHYYYNTVFPQDMDELLYKQLLECDTLIIAGYQPFYHNALSNIKRFITNLHACYQTDEETEYIGKIFSIYENKKVEIELLYETKSWEYWLNERVSSDIDQLYKRRTFTMSFTEFNKIKQEIKQSIYNN